MKFVTCAIGTMHSLPNSCYFSSFRRNTSLVSQMLQVTKNMANCLPRIRQRGNFTFTESTDAASPLYNFPE
jgi:hypothetical protein